MLTLGQLINLGKTADIDIFDGLTLPEGSPLDRDTLINTIIEKCGLNIPMYADPFVMASAITLWSARNQYTFEHVGKIFSASYSPIENKDYYEDITIERERDMTDNTTGTSEKSEDLTTGGTTTANENKTTAHTGTDKTTEEDTTSASNSSSYQPFNKTETDILHGETITENGTIGTTSNGSSNKTISGTLANDKTIDENEKTGTTSHQHGNIGVSTFFDLQGGEYKLLAEYNPYTFISGLFENELTLFVY
jgi:hypothetical protein